ncbi:LTA synthase family protein [Flavobacterium sp.]|uniref:LTA synthase family protein n=1 Tax=Flavobacterium sp. TaxID=239 RepID=UPI002625234A|nr:alkaline phosphatase family protein [Flavobacterium sp.]
MKLLNRHSPILQLGIIYLAISFITRIVLFFHPITQSSFEIVEVLKIIVLGLFSDVFIYILGSSLLLLYLVFLSNEKYKKPYGIGLFAIHILLLLYLLSGKSILHEYGGSLPEIGIAFVSLKTILFGLLLFLPKHRNKIRLGLFATTIFIFVLVIVQNAISEYFFWNKFGVRYNFIAVDYLVYTNEVIKNIMESYPIIPLFTGVGVITLAITYFVVKRTKPFLKDLPTFNEKIKSILIYTILFSTSLFVLPFLAKKENSTNMFSNELQANGIYKFYLAFMNSELEYNKFYKTLPNAEAVAILQKQIPDFAADFSARVVKNSNQEIHKNVVLITIESLSADFMNSYGSDKNITPFLDSLSSKSLNFKNLYAVGNRTVRGLEAVTLCLPPTAGESVIKRKDNAHKFTTGSVFKEKGYAVKFLYGGDSYFDNMESFYAGNGYEIVDKKTVKPDDITFSNVWGICDEDMAKIAINVMNKEAKTGKPFFNHWMTVSNHRPFTYPDGKIDIDSHSKSREGGVKYTDYALRQFFKMASTQSWFKNTVFVIVADHCASSSGKTELPLDKYRIPGFIYSPGFIDAGNYTDLCSQIDLMPTLFGLLNFSYKSKFFGQDVLKTDYKPRAFIATYEDLGYIKNDVLTILSPKQKVKQYKLELVPDKYPIYFNQTLMKKENVELKNEAVSYYQTTSYILKHKKDEK